MALQFIFGGSGSGKSDYLYKKMIKESGVHPDLNYMVLVPEQFTMQTQKDLVLMSENKGIMNIDVLSFGRLAHRIFEETGRGRMPVLDDEGKNLVLRKIAGDYEDKLAVLGGNIKKLGYISEVKSVLSEFTQYDVGMDEIEHMITSAGEDSYLAFKLRDMKVLYEGFQNYLQDKYITKEELLDVLCEAADYSDLLKKSVVVLDGFTGFTPVQNRLLKKLLGICKDVIVTVTMDEKEDPYTYAHPYQLFAMSKQTVSSLVQIARDISAPVKEPVCLYQRPYYRFKDSKELEFLEQHLFRYSRAVYEENPEAIQIHVAVSPREEALAVAGQVRRLIRTWQYRYREIGVVVSDMTAYADYLEQAFAKYQIPVFMDHKRSILLNSFVEYVRSLLAMAEQNYTYESVFRFLRAGYSHYTYEEMDQLENYVVALGIRGYKKWQEQWIRRTRDMKEEDLDMLNHLRVQFVEQMDPLMFVLRQRKKTVQDITMAVYEFFVRENMQTRLMQQEEHFTQRGELALAKEYAQIYKIVLDLFDKFVELLGDEPVSIAEYCKLLDAGLNEAKVGVIPPGVDQVVVGDMERTRLKDIKALLFLGANDTFLPGGLMQTGLLSERDREKFAGEHIPLTPGGKEKAYVQKFYLYLNLTKPTQKLYLFYSKVSAAGKSIRPSYLIQEIRRLYPGLVIVEEDRKNLRQMELSGATGREALIDGLRMNGEEAGSSWMELYSWYKKRPEWKQELELLLDARFYQCPDSRLGAQAARELYGSRFEDSITRMEKFSSCAYAHFLSYGLHLRERQEYEFQALDMGNLFHGAIERYSKKAENTGLGWTGLDTVQREQLVAESVEEAVTDYGNSILYSSARNEYLITRMKHMMNRTVWALTKQLAQGDFEPTAYELRFGNGKIDRVDTCVDKEEVYVKVMDYKTGSMAFDISSLYHGLQLQLMVYMNAAMDMAGKKYPGKEIIPSGVFYYRIQDPLIEKNKENEDEPEFQELELLKALKPDGIVNLEKESLRHLDSSMEGESVVIPVKFNKNQSLSKASKAVGGEDFRVMTDYALHKVADLHQGIVSGDAGIRPYRQGTRSGCDYCPYGHVCGFDTAVPGYEYRDIGKMAEQESIGKMKGELQS